MTTAQQQTPRAKTGGRKAGTPNKATANVKAFLGRVFDHAFNDPGFEAELKLQIASLQIDPKLFLRLLEYYAGAPAKQVELGGKLTLEQIVSGHGVEDDVDDDGDALAEAA